MNETESSRNFTLTDLPLAARLVLAAFLITTGIGYASALVQLRVQHAKAGEVMPGVEDVRRVFHGVDGQSQFERLLTAPMNLPQDGGGSMQFAIMELSEKEVAREVKQIQKNESEGFKEWPSEKLVELVRHRHEGELKALVDWVREGAPQEAYEKNKYRNDRLAGDLHLEIEPPEMVKPDDTVPWITEKYRVAPNAGQKGAIKIADIITDRCARCHSANVSRRGSDFPLESYEDIAFYTTVDKAQGMSLTKLAQSTHVHLLGFAVLWCMTGLIFACTGLPGWIRAVFGPWTLVAQVADIACWWLAAVDVRFADVIMVTGGLVGLGLGIQILGGCLSMFRKGGWFLMLLVLIFVGFGVATVYFKAVEPRFKNGKSAMISLLDKPSPA